MSKFTQVSKTLEKSNPTAAQKIKDEGWLKHLDTAPIYSRKDREIQVLCNVTRVLTFPEVTPSGNIDYIKEFDYTHNLITLDGDRFYTISDESISICTFICYFGSPKYNCSWCETNTCDCLSSSTCVGGKPTSFNSKDH